jgi:GH24 family phage-related lysozyme (muramidase)
VDSNCVVLTRYFYTAAERSDADIASQLEQAAVIVDAWVTRPLLPFQKDALLCLVSDIVAGLASSPSTSFQYSFLVSAINRGMFHVAAAEFYTFSFVADVFDEKAWRKRQAEQYLFARGKLLFDDPAIKCMT